MQQKQYCKVCDTHVTNWSRHEKSPEHIKACRRAALRASGALPLSHAVSVITQETQQAVGSRYAGGATGFPDRVTVRAAVEAALSSVRPLVADGEEYIDRKLRRLVEAAVLQWAERKRELISQLHQAYETYSRLWKTLSDDLKVAVGADLKRFVNPDGSLTPEGEKLLVAATIGGIVGGDEK